MSVRSENMSLGWLDLGEEDQRRARDYLAQFKADNTLDELGFGILRDAFADVFFPGTNTIMTRTRYLIFIPALCLTIEREKLTGKAAERRLTDLENQLREALSKEESQGVIGERAKESLSRYPSSIYWSALRRLGLFQHPNWGLAYYQAHLSEFHAAMTAEKDDDGLSHLSCPERRNWDRALCDILADGKSVVVTGANLPASLNFSLTRAEARYLRDKYKALSFRDARPSILSHLIERAHVDVFRYPWDVPCPEELESYVKHARCFSMLTRGATLQYFQLLLRKRESSGIANPVSDLSAVFERWRQATRQDLAAWNVDEFIAIASGIDGLRRDNDAAFIRAWLKLNIESASAPGMLENAEAQDLVRRREKITRPTKSRLHHSEYLQRWTPPEQSEMESMADNPDTVRFGLDYRAWIGCTFVRDIVGGLEGAS